MNETATKPRLIFFQYKYAPNVPFFLLIHKDEHVRCLSEFFDVIVISEDCDYQQICDKYNPDLTLFETGLQIKDVRQAKITNTRMNLNVPKLAFMNADPWGGTCSRVISDMDRWGISTLFSNSVTAPEHMRGITDDLFVWPNFIDQEVFRDYGLTKNIPIILTGSRDPQYPWRHKVYKLLSDFFPVLNCPHHGYYSQSSIGQMLVGENYARILNAAWFAPTCGTVAKEVVRKHLEIPGAKACLLTERSEALEAAGFIDFENCVFVDNNDILDKISYLIENQNKLQEIIDGGYRLIHSRHTMRHRNQIYQWFMLQQNLLSKTIILQPNPYEPFEVVMDTTNIKARHIICNGIHLKYIQEAEKLRLLNKYKDAESCYLQCLNYTSSILEARLGIAICNLHMGKPKVALTWIMSIIRDTLTKTEGIEPDPVHWSYLIISMLCLGKPKQAITRANQFPTLHHPEIERTRLAVSLLTNTKVAHNSDSKYPTIIHRSFHLLPVQNLNDWLQGLSHMLYACGQSSAANILSRYLMLQKAPVVSNGNTYEDELNQSSQYSCTLKPQPALQNILFPILRRKPLHGLDNPLLAETIREKLNKKVQYLTNFFQPQNKALLNPKSQVELTEFIKVIQTCQKNETYQSALILGDLDNEPVAYQFVNLLKGRNKKLNLFCIGSKPYKLPLSNSSLIDIGQINFYQINSKEGIEKSRELDDIIRIITIGQKLDSFDSVLVLDVVVNNHKIKSRFLNLELHKSKLIVVTNTNRKENFLLKTELLKDLSYTLIAQDMVYSEGFAIFQKHSQTPYKSKLLNYNDSFQN